ncbi:MAG TPA: hypothetical protein VF160_08410 [Candidatus Dormibacteraeota bacterium]
MKIYTFVQLAETALFAAVLLYGLLIHRPSLAALGGGLLVGKATLNILWPEGGTLLRRSIIGYAVGAIYVSFAVLTIIFLK